MTDSGEMADGADRAAGGELADAAAGAAGRRLSQLRYDLHDGPQQDVHVLGQDLRLFREQLAPLLDGHPDRARALARLDDLEAQLVALGDGLRRLATSARWPLPGPGSVAQVVTQLAQALTTRTGIVPRTQVSGAVESIAEPQRTALLSLIREALANVRRHSGAEAVRIAIAADAGAVTVEVRDDGRGFDPPSTEARAAQTGRLGLLGMRERVRMLGGRIEISSRPGGPTVVRATLPRPTDCR